MTDHLDRIFVEICYDGKKANKDDLVQRINDFTAECSGWEEIESVNINPDRPPRIFSDAELEDRFLNLYKTAEKYRAGLEGRLGIKLSLDPRLLYLVTISAFDDIERYKAYHLERPYSDRSDAVKRSAFLTKWIAKIGPYQTIFSEGDDPRDVKPALANILFALTVSTIHISIDTGKNFKINQSAMHDLCYDLLYRRVNEDALLSTFQKFVRILRDENLLDINS